VAQCLSPHRCTNRPKTTLTPVLDPPKDARCPTTLTTAMQIPTSSLPDPRRHQLQRLPYHNMITKCDPPRPMLSTPQYSLSGVTFICEYSKPPRTCYKNIKFVIACTEKHWKFAARMSLCELPHDTLMLVLTHVCARDLARFAATSKSYMHAVETVLRQRAIYIGRGDIATMVVGEHMTPPLYMARLYWLHGENHGVLATGLTHVFCISGTGTIFQCSIDQPQSPKILQLSPVPSLTAHRIRSIAAGYGFTTAVTCAGAVFTWGECRLPGLLGHGNEKNIEHPTQVAAFQGTRVLSVSNGPSHCIAITESGAAWSWGLNTFGQCGQGDFDRIVVFPRLITHGLERFHIQGASCGFNHTLLFSNDGQLFMTGSHACVEVAYCTPSAVKELRDHHIIAVSTGLYHSIALSLQGVLFAWGRNSHGQLGNGSLDDTSKPHIVCNLSNVHTIAAGGMTSCAITATKCGIFMWGEGYGTEPIYTAHGCGVAVSVGTRITVAIRCTGEVFGWNN
jgi:hypothetical protein